MVVLAVAALYVISARLGLMLALPPEKKATAVWPPSGIALAALLIFGTRVSPGIWLGAFLANLWDYFDPANRFTFASHFLVSCGIATGSTIQALVGNYLIRRWIGSNNPFDRASHAFTFAGVALLMCLVAATMGAASLYLGGFAPARALGFLWWTWWLGDMTGVLTVGSLLLTWRRWPGGDWGIRRMAEAALLLALMLLLACVIFGIASPWIGVPPPLAYLTVPFLVWAAFRFGQHGASAALFLISGVAVWGTALGTGPFAQPTVHASLLLLQVFMGVIAVTAMVMAAVLSERRGAEEKVHRWEHISANAGWPVAVVNPEDNSLQAVNAAFATMHGYSVEELIGKPLTDTLVPDCRDDLPKHMHAANKDDNYTYESVHVRKDGSHFPCQAHVTVFKDTQGKVVYRAATLQDLTELKKAEAVLRENEKRLSTLAAAVPGFLFTNLPDGRCDYISQAYYDYTGRSPALAEGLGWADAVHPEDRERTQAEFQQCIYEKTRYEGQCRILGADGSYRWFLVRSVPQLDESGQVIKWFGICTDIEDQRRAQETLRRSHNELETLVGQRTAELSSQTQTLQAVLNAFPDLFFRLDSKGVILAYSAARSSDLYVPPEVFMGKRMQDVLPSEVGSLFRAAIDQVRDKNELHAIEYDLPLASGERSFEARLVPVLQGQIIVIVRDMTHRKKAEDALRQAKEASEAANRAKSEFLANMSHEIRTPMNGVIGMTDLVLDTDMTAEQRDYMNSVKQSAESLLTVINDILDFSKIEAGRLDLDPIPFNLRTSLGDLLRPLAVRARKKGLELTCEFEPDVPDALEGDIGRLRQVIVNLLGNAIKFTNQGRVAIRVSAEALTSEDLTLCVSVADTGVGIPADRLGAIFAPFEQVDGSMARKFGGTGLGLAISARLVEMMSGRLWAESTVGKGSTFHFTVRMKQQLKPWPASSLSDSSEWRLVRELRPLRIVLAEDNIINQKVTTVPLESAGHHVILANNGLEAVAAVERETVDLVLMDVQMPEMDGIDATQIIREKETVTGRHIPIIALTAHAMKGDRERFREAGMDGYVAKPIRHAELWRAIVECVPNAVVKQ